MPMNVQAIPSLSDRVNQIRMMTAKIVNNEILPNENQLWATRRDGQVDDVPPQHEIAEVGPGVVRGPLEAICLGGFPPFAQVG